MPTDEEPDPARSFDLLIREATGCPPEDVHLVERAMVHELGLPLAEVHPELFRDHARRLYRFLVSLRKTAETPDETARVMGWTRAEFDAYVKRYLGPV